MSEIYRKIKENCWVERFAVLMIGILLVFGTLYRTGTIASGFHMLDDHELIRYHLAFSENNASLAGTIKAAIVNDFAGGRYRPLYWTERVTGCKLFGDELAWWNYYTAIKGVLTFYFLYYVARYLKYNRILSFLFVGIILFGRQFTPWFRSANQESTGLLLCAFTLCLIARQCYHKKYNNVAYNIVIVVGTVLCGLVKESFTLFMPVFAALKIWLEYCDRGKLVNCLRKNIAVYLVIALSMMINVIMIVFYVGIDQVSYAGFHEGVSLADYWSGIVYSLKFNMGSYTIAGGVFLFAIVMYVLEISKELRKKYLWFAAISAYVMAVQLIAHAKSLMWERYMIPWVVGYAFLFVLLGYRIFEQNKWRRTVYTAVLIILFLVEAPKAYQMSRDYAYDGQMLRVYFQNILDNTDEESQVVCAFRDEEINLATECWLEVHGRTQVYSYDTLTGEFKNIVQLKGAVPEEFSWEQARVVVCYGDQVEIMLQLMGLSEESSYSVNQCSSYCVISVL